MARLEKSPPMCQTADEGRAREEERKTLHDIRNHLFVIGGLCELLAADVSEGDPKHADLLEIRKSADAARALTLRLSDLLKRHA
jgi:hypothetical protein